MENIDNTGLLLLPLLFGTWWVFWDTCNHVFCTEFSIQCQHAVFSLFASFPVLIYASIITWIHRVLKILLQGLFLITRNNSSNFGQDSFHLHLWKKTKHLDAFIVSLHSAFIQSTGAQGSSFKTVPQPLVYRYSWQHIDTGKVKSDLCEEVLSCSLCCPEVRKRNKIKNFFSHS